MKVGRKRVKDQPSRTAYREQGEVLDYIYEWVLNPHLLKLFKKGKLSVEVWEDILHLGYLVPDKNLEIKVHIDLRGENRREFDEMKEMVRAFLLNIYYSYEWMFNPMTESTLGVLSGQSRQGIHKEIHEMFDKLKSNEITAGILVKCTAV